MRAREFDAAALNAHAAALVLGFIDEVGASGWDFRYLPDLGVSLALPLDAPRRPPRPRRAASGAGADDGRADRPHPPLRRERGAPLACGARGQGQRRRRGARRPSGAPTCWSPSGVLRDGRELLHPLGPDRRRAGPRSSSPASPTRPGALNLAAAQHPARAAAALGPARGRPAQPARRARPRRSSTSADRAAPVPGRRSRLAARGGAAAQPTSAAPAPAPGFYLGAADAGDGAARGGRLRPRHPRRRPRARR